MNIEPPLPAPAPEPPDPEPPLIAWPFVPSSPFDKMVPLTWTWSAMIRIYPPP